MAVSRESAVIIERRPLDTSPAARLNSYNHHTLAPWLKETGYLTPLFLHKRQKEIAPCNMGQWLSQGIQRHMLHAPVAIHRLSVQEEVAAMLDVALEVQINATMGGFGKNSPLGYFVRMSHCSPKDADAGTLRTVFTIKEALVKLASSNQLFFFPYHADLDRLSEWRCYINKNRVVTITQSRFYQCNHQGITDNALRSLAMQVKSRGFVVNLVEINPWGAHAGSGSLLFHWLDDADILNRAGSGPEPAPAVVIRLVEEGESPVLSRDEAYWIGRERIIKDELRCLRERGLKWVLGDDAHAKFMALPLPGASPMPTTRKDGPEIFQRKRAGDDRIGDGKRSTARDHPRFVKLKRALHD
ncbi:unnamed protein product [Colletotrichum noveboracense]|uniref:Uncharacterized protein n=1 Tax=Colletotrichum noveboracense TaxID=2664923 RepID=A0A9W4RQQ9_9PEZI|nr:unnamed protein product [Colletotrichum noveboracense]